MLKEGQVAINITEGTANRLQELSYEKNMPIGRYMNQQLENFADKNNLSLTEEATFNQFNKILNFYNLSDKAKTAFAHLQNTMLEKIINVNDRDILVKDEVENAIKTLRSKGFSNRMILVNCVCEGSHEDDEVEQALSVLEKEFITFADNDFDKLVEILYIF